MISELVIGDAYGRGFRGADREFVFKKNETTHYVKNPANTHLAGHYSGNAQGAMAIGDLMLSGLPWSEENCARFVLRHFKNFRRFGIDEHLQLAFETSFAPDQFLEQTGTLTDGTSCVRVCPCGLLPNLDDVLNHAEIAAKITHGQSLVVQSAQIAAAMVHFAHCRSVSKDGMLFKLRQVFPNLLQVPLAGKVSEHALVVVSAALTAFVRNSSMKELLWNCVNMGGPTEHVAAIAMAAGSVCPEYKQDLPHTLYFGLEGGERGGKYIGKLDEQLMKIPPNCY